MTAAGAKPGAILAVDQGTTNTKALLVSPAGAVLARASRPMTLDHPQQGWAEQSALDIWASVVEVIAELVRAHPQVPVLGVAISNQRETIVLWDVRDGRPVAPAISWQCRRSAPRCKALREAGHEALLLERTGLGIDPLFPAAKLGWLLDEIPGARDKAQAGHLRAGTVDSWLLWNLTGGKVHATDVGNASRTQLFNRHSLNWDNDLAALFGVPVSLLGQVGASGSHFGDVAAGATALPGGVPICAIMGDSHAALFGHGIDAPGAAKVTIGTGSSIMTLTSAPVRSSHGLSGTIAWGLADGVRHALEGNITVSGQAAAFAARLLDLPDPDALTALAQSVDDSGGVAFVPALAGMGAPHWQPAARGILTGMTLGTGRGHVARAVFEAMAMQIVDVCRAVEADTGRALPGISVDGGATQNAFLLQLLADLLDRPVNRLANPELSALGVARMAAQVLGLAEAREAGAAGEVVSFAPRMAQTQREAIQEGWRSALQQVLGAC